MCPGWFGGHLATALSPSSHLRSKRRRKRSPSRWDSLTPIFIFCSESGLFKSRRPKHIFGRCLRGSTAQQRPFLFLFLKSDWLHKLWGHPAQSSQDYLSCLTALCAVSIKYEKLVVSNQEDCERIFAQKPSISHFWHWRFFLTNNSCAIMHTKRQLRLKIQNFTSAKIRRFQNHAEIGHFLSDSPNLFSSKGGLPIHCKHILLWQNCLSIKSDWMGVRDSSPW